MFGVFFHEKLNKLLTNQKHIYSFSLFPQSVNMHYNVFVSKVEPLDTRFISLACAHVQQRNLPLSADKCEGKLLVLNFAHIFF